MNICIHVKYPSFLTHFNKISKFLDKCSIYPQVRNFMKIRLVEFEFFLAGVREGGLADGRTDKRVDRETDRLI